MGAWLAEVAEGGEGLWERIKKITKPPSLHAVRIRGGSEVSIYADHCSQQIERRTITGETQAQTTVELQEIVERLATQDPTFKATVKPTAQHRPFEIGTDASIVQILEQAMAARIGHKPSHTGQAFWTDAALLVEASMDTVLLGPSGHGLHSA